jgi:putative Holliday junction resolvase
LGLVHPLGYVEAEPRREMLERVRKLAAERGCAGLVVGLPINMDGTEGPAARGARALGEELGRMTGLPVDYYDERLTSRAAQRSLAAAGFRGRRGKARTDEVAAAIMLEGYLARRRRAARQGTEDDQAEPPRRK